MKQEEFVPIAWATPKGRQMPIFPVVAKGPKGIGIHRIGSREITWVSREVACAELDTYPLNEK